ncbi:hypothetical protein RHGRI_024550 [Rhododendron griersonianum]|uniref:Uncharacterized protein n=1 Tax=Rhododendron griersonianum TaxID=479676 RepID=A0AAV6JBD6_9ERIC|nr:hypothetical protein RHGRI_024550 [Rhododendron griersonianum]
MPATEAATAVVPEIYLIAFHKAILQSGRDPKAHSGTAASRRPRRGSEKMLSSSVLIYSDTVLDAFDYDEIKPPINQVCRYDELFLRLYPIYVKVFVGLSHQN